MKLSIIDYDTNIVFLENHISVLIIENMKLFYNILSDLNNLSLGYDNDIVNFFDDDKQVNLSKKISIYMDYFNIDYNSKNILNKLYETINGNLLPEDNNKIQLLINDIMKLYNTYISNVDLDLEYNDSISFIDLCKLLKLKIKSQCSSLLDKILLIIDFESQLHVNKLIVFVNIKQFLDKKEIELLYEYIIAKKVNILLIENRTTYSLKDECIKIIDSDFDEYKIN